MLTTSIVIGIICLIYAFVTDMRGDGLHTPTKAAIALGIGIACVLGGITGARGAEFEASIGQTSGNNGASYMVGLTGMAHPGLRYHVGLAELGHPSYQAYSTTAGAADDIPAGEGNGPYYLHRSSFEYRELYATIAPEWYSGKWTFAIEAGAGIYRPISFSDLPVGTPTDSYGLAVTPIIGASIGYGKTSLVLTAQQIRSHTDLDYGPQISGNQITLSVRQRF